MTIKLKQLLKISGNNQIRLRKALRQELHLLIEYKDAYNTFNNKAIKESLKEIRNYIQRINKI